ncbi:hypothetical protein SEA_ATUIN_164 [Arthrobacter phage Atuin]|nr:hypothetical protein SEA_ATUIN_263 [Arthrobacter phage Atuin]
MLGDFQKYEVTTKFTFESEVFPEDPDDVFELAELEAKSVATELSIAFPELEIQDLTVVPVTGE